MTDEAAYHLAAHIATLSETTRLCIDANNKSLEAQTLINHRLALMETNISLRLQLESGAVERVSRTAERTRIREELKQWLIGRTAPEDAGLVNGRRIVDEIERICSGE